MDFVKREIINLYSNRPPEVISTFYITSKYQTYKEGNKIKTNKFFKQMIFIH